MMASWWAAADLLDGLEENSIVSQVIQAVGLFGDILSLEDTMEPMLFEGKKAVEEGDGDNEEEEEQVANEGGDQLIEDWVDKDKSGEEEDKAGKEFGIEETKMEAVHEDGKEEEKVERKDKDKSQGVGSEEVEKDTERQDELQKVVTEDIAGKEEKEDEDEDDEEREVKQDVENEQEIREDENEAVEGGSEDRGADVENEEEAEEEEEKLKTQGEEECEDDRAETKELGGDGKEDGETEAKICEDKLFEKDEKEETEAAVNPKENAEGPGEESENQSDPSPSQRPPQDPECAETLTRGAGNEDSNESEDAFLSSSNASSQTAAADSVMDTDLDLSGSDVCLDLSGPAQSSQEQQLFGHPGETPEDTRDTLIELHSSGWRPESQKVMLMDAAAMSLTEGRQEKKELGPTRNSSSTGNRVVEGKEEKGQNSSKIEVDAAGGERKDRRQSSKYKTVSYRRIRRGNTRQRIDEFETMINS